MPTAYDCTVMHFASMLGYQLVQGIKIHKLQEREMLLRSTMGQEIADRLIIKCDSNAYIEMCFRSDGSFHSMNTRYT